MWCKIKIKKNKRKIKKKYYSDLLLNLRIT